MFSSFTSFLPASLRDTPRVTQPIQQEEEQPRPEAVQSPPEPAEETQPQKRKRDRERRQPNEVFVIVRPPPSKSNHPLNLQVQLVPPHSKAVLPRSSIEFEAGQSAALYRTSSNHSQESSATCGSTASFSSTASGASTATSSSSSSRRAIVPLYNLQAHTVLPNVIVDAGTDAKIAKFQKRGIELVDLVLLEPVEVWPDPNAVAVPVGVTATTLSVPIVGPEASTSTLGRFSVDEMGFAQIHARGGTTSGRNLVAPVGISSSRPTTPEASAVITATSSSSSLPSASEQTRPSEFVLKPDSLSASGMLPPNSGKRTIFGKIFKKNGREASPIGSTTPVPSPSLLSNANKHQLLSTPSQQSPIRRDTTNSIDLSNSTSLTPTQLQHLGTPTSQQYPYLGSKVVPPAGSKRGSGIRGPWLLGSPTSIKGPTQAPQSPLAAAFSSLGIKRRPASHSGYEADSGSISLNEAQDDLGASSQPASAHILASVPPSNQAQSQPSQSVLGVQPARCVVSSNVVNASRSYRRNQSRSPDDEVSRSIERTDANGLVNGGKPLKDKDKALRRVYMYIWLARKWMKRRPSSPQHISYKQENHTRFGLSLPGAKGLGLDTTRVHSFKGQELGVEETVEVRFEWKRGSISTNLKKKQNDANNNGTAAGVEEDPEDRRDEGRRSHSQQREEQKTARGVENVDAGIIEKRSRKHSVSSVSSARAAVKRWSLLSHQSRSTGGGSEEGDGDEDPGDESDPEDSETPWICTLKVRKTNIAATKEAGTNLSMLHTSSHSIKARGRSKGGAADDCDDDTVKNVLKIKVGTLSPTPHHPKVVAMLKVTFPLPDVQIERLEVVKRNGLGAISDENVNNYYGLTLTAEEIKDIICSTSLWLIVRENIGGVGKVQRKGDGWMIRS